MVANIIIHASQHKWTCKYDSMDCDVYYVLCGSGVLSLRCVVLEASIRVE